MTSEPLTPEQKLAAMFAAAEAPAVDRTFVAEVARRMAIRRAAATMTATVPWVIAATVILWALSPTIVQVMDGLSTALTPVLNGVALAGLVLVGAGMMDETLRRRLIGSFRG